MKRKEFHQQELSLENETSLLTPQERVKIFFADSDTSLNFILYTISNKLVTELLRSEFNFKGTARDPAAFNI